MLIAASSDRRRAPRISDRRRRAGAADLQHAADDDDAADRVGHAHQRRVQRRRHVPDDHVADEAREHEHGEVLRGTPAAPKSADGASSSDRRQRRAIAVARRCRLLLAVGRAPRRRAAAAAVGLGAPARRRRPAAAAATCISPSLTPIAPRMDLVLEVDVERRLARPCTSPRAGAAGCRVELARLARQPARQIGVADDRDAVTSRRPCPGSVSSQLPPCSAAMSTITEPGLHRRHQLGGDQLRRRLAGDQRGGDDDVDVLRLLRRTAPARPPGSLRSSPWRSRRRPRPSSSKSTSTNSPPRVSTWSRDRRPRVVGAHDARRGRARRRSPRGRRRRRR